MFASIILVRLLLVAVVAVLLWALFAGETGAGGPERQYRVQAGDTLWSIAVADVPGRPARRRLGAEGAKRPRLGDDRPGPGARPPGVGRASHALASAASACDPRAEPRRRRPGPEAAPWRANASSSSSAGRPRRRGARRDPRALEDPLEGRGQPRHRRAALDADRGLRLQRRGHGRALGGPRGRDALLHRAPDGVPRHPLRPRLHRDRPAGRLRGGDRDGDPRGALARPRADRREARVAERDLLPVGSRGAPLQGRDGLHRPRSSPTG